MLPTVRMVQSNIQMCVYVRSDAAGALPTEQSFVQQEVFHPSL